MDIDTLLARLRAAAATREPGWLEAQVGGLIEDVAGGSREGSRTPRARRSHPPERYSPTPTARAQRHSRSPQGDPSPPPAKRTHALAGGEGGRHPPPSLGPVGGASGSNGARTPATRRSSIEQSVPSQSVGTAGGGSQRTKRGATAGGSSRIGAAGSQEGGRPESPERRPSRGGRAAETPTAGAKGRGRSAGRLGSTASRPPAPGRQTSPVSPASEDPSGDEGSEAEEVSPTVELSVSAVRDVPGQPVQFARSFQYPVEVISAEGRDVVLPINETGVSEIYWIFDKTHIGTTRAEGRIEVKNNKFKGRLHCVDGVSLKISNVTRKDQGTYTANVLEVHPEFHLKVYPVLLDNDINIHANLTNNGTCSLALICLTNASNVTIFWSYPNTSDLYISDRTLHISNVYPNITCNCTAKNPVSNVSRTVTPGQYCHQEGNTSQLQFDKCPLWGIVLPTTIVFMIIIIIIIFLLYKKRKSKNIGTEKDTEVSTICDKVPLAETSLRQKQLAVYTQLQHVIQLQGK